jgi:arylsulfatase A-like enzyme
MGKQPNILLINCDDLGYGDLGCYGNTVHRTPQLDRMAAEGLRFTDFYMPASVCSPSRGGMMTGCYPQRIGFGWFENRWVLLPGHAVGLNPEEITIARLLRDAGYTTKLVGKWHCGDQSPFLPTAHGFDSFYGLPYSNDMGRQSNKPNYPPLPLMRGETVVQQQPDQCSLTERYVEEAVRFIRENRQRPFFLYFAHMYVHTPLFVSDVFRKRSWNGNYGAAVDCIDWAAGALLHELENQGLAENTLVIFTSDNGGKYLESNQPLRGTKGSTWEGGMRLLCIMRWPGQIPAGSTCQEIATAMDFYPTLAGLAGADLPDDRIIDGKDIRSLILAGGAGSSPHEAVFYYLSNRLEAVRCGQWKLHVCKSKRPNSPDDTVTVANPEDNPDLLQVKPMRELYDLYADPGETRNCYDEHPEVVADLTARIEACRRDLGDTATGVIGENVRPIGRVQAAAPLTEYDPNHPYLIDEYDLEE